MFIHMPKKIGIPVMLAVAACLGAYYVFVVRSERVGDWRVYQGSGRLSTEPEGGRECLDVSYAVRRPARPLFSYVWTPRAAADNAPPALAFEYQSEWPAALRAVVVEDGRAVWEAHVDLVHADDWTLVMLPPEAFTPAAGAARTRPGPRWRRARRVDFYDGAGVTNPSTVFSNRLKLTPPGFSVTVEPAHP